ncbi:disease resistance protein RPV1-like [Ziziphus jujuba]|uniref:Disease resistance protein RPV1-like n=1 Tax=Ziziphus jujuba TaxID=326968 RepID=A0ABM3ZUN1_ZIZJJ|nr:disease resistance protein RPV1-like [Ziziphus jujuba]
MASSSSSYAAMIHPQEKKYRVFVSYRGVDTHDSFTSHLYIALRRKNIHTFIDDRVARGDEISPALLKAIKESKLSIVMPVFYRVDPSRVRKQKGNYAATFTKLKERF